MRGKYDRIINHIKSKIAEINTVKIKECLYTYVPQNVIDSPHCTFILRSSAGVAYVCRDIEFWQFPVFIVADKSVQSCVCFDVQCVILFSK